VLPLVDLAHQFSPDQPFYGLQAVGLYGEREPYKTIEEMAARFVDEIRSIQPEGPYVIGGLSYGGTVAFEMAQQLYDKNQTVSLLAILDTLAPCLDSEAFDHGTDRFLLAAARSTAESNGQTLSLALEEFKQLDLEARLEFVLDQLRVAQPPGGNTKLEQSRRALKLYQYHGRAIQNYQPRVYPGRITLFRSSEVDTNSVAYQYEKNHPSFNDPVLGWSSLSQEPIDVYHVPGSHTKIVVEPHVRVLAQHLRACIEKNQEVLPHKSETLVNRVSTVAR
jgi:thioesterase domain-containing protein